MTNTFLLMDHFIEADPEEGSVAIYDISMDEMLTFLEKWCGANGTIYVEIGYGYGDLDLGYGETGTMTIIITYQKPSDAFLP